MHLFLLDSCKIYAQLLPGTKNVRRSERFKIITRKGIWKYPSRLVFLYPPVGRDLGSGILILGRQCVHWSHSICSKEYPQNVPSPPGEERASAYLMPNDWGEGGDEQPFIWAVTLFRKTTPSWEVGLSSGHQRIHHRRFHRQVRFH
jgi:hypothetical protein